MLGMHVMEPEYPYAESGFNMEILGVTDRSHSLLFAGNSFDSKPLDAAKTLRHLVADTGTVVWRFPDSFPEGMTRD